MPPTTVCPMCRGVIHPLAGRCKHCKANLAELRERANRAARAYSMGAVVPPSPLPSGPPPGPGGMTHRAGGTAIVPPPGGTETGAARGAMTAATVPGGGAHGGAPHAEAPASADRAALPVGRRIPAAALPPSPRRQGDASGPLSRAANLSSERERSGLARKWPLLVSAAALLVIGISIGVLAERWLSQPSSSSSTDGQVRAAALSPHRVPDHMPSPILPGPGAPRAVPPAPDAPPSATPFAAPRAPTAPPGRGGGTGSGGGDAEAFRAFASGLANGVCEKLSTCGVIDGPTALLCQAFASTFDAESAADKIARGECSFSQKAADSCLQAVATLSCDPSTSGLFGGGGGGLGGLGGGGLGGLGGLGAGGLGGMMGLLGAPTGFAQCAEAFSCL